MRRCVLGCVVLALSVAGACGGPEDLTGAGSECFRDDDCSYGLVCAVPAGEEERVCTSDVSGLVSEVDAGLPQAGSEATAGASPAGGAAAAGANAGGAGGTAGSSSSAGSSGASQAGSGGAPGSGGSGTAGSTAGMAGEGGG